MKTYIDTTRIHTLRDVKSCHSFPTSPRLTDKVRKEGQGCLQRAGCLETTPFTDIQPLDLNFGWMIWFTKIFFWGVGAKGLESWICSWDWSANNQVIDCMSMNQRKVMDWMICGLAMLFGERFPGYVEDAGWRDHVRKLMLDFRSIQLSPPRWSSTSTSRNHLQFRNMLIMLHIFHLNHLHQDRPDSVYLFYL